MVAPHLHYKITDNSSKPVLMIVHGLFGSLDNWQSLAKKWSESFRVISVDVRNHGRSFHSDDMKFESLVNDLHSIISHENVRKLYLLGHSMGGKTAMLFAVKYPKLERDSGSFTNVEAVLKIVLAVK